MIQSLKRVTSLCFIIMLTCGLLLGLVQLYRSFYAPKAVSNYVEQLEYEARLRGRSPDYRSMDIEVVTSLNMIGPEVMGICLVNPVTLQTTILISKFYWNYLSEGARLMLIAHELGHCYHYLSHDDTSYNIMNTYSNVSDTVTKELLDDYFKRAYSDK